MESSVGWSRRKTIASSASSACCSSCCAATSQSTPACICIKDRAPLHQRQLILPPAALILLHFLEKMRFNLILLVFGLVLCLSLADANRKLPFNGSIFGKRSGNQGIYPSSFLLLPPPKCFHPSQMFESDSLMADFFRASRHVFWYFNNDCYLNVCSVLSSKPFQRLNLLTKARSEQSNSTSCETNVR